MIFIIIFIIVIIVSVISPIPEFTGLGHIQDHPENVGVHLFQEMGRQATGLPGSNVVFEYQQDPIRLGRDDPAIRKADDGGSINDHVLELLAELLDQVLKHLGTQELYGVGRHCSGRNEEKPGNLGGLNNFFQRNGAGNKVAEPRL